MDQSTMNPQTLEAAVTGEGGARPPPPSDAETLPYVLGQWKGMTSWQCRLCPWDTLEGEERILWHIATQHRLTRLTVPSPILGPNGRPLREEGNA